MRSVVHSLAVSLGQQQILLLCISLYNVDWQLVQGAFVWALDVLQL